MTFNTTNTIINFEAVRTGTEYPHNPMDATIENNEDLEDDDNNTARLDGVLLRTNK